MAHTMERPLKACHHFTMLIHEPHMRRRLRRKAGRCSCATRRRAIRWRSTACGASGASDSTAIRCIACGTRDCLPRVDLPCQIKVALKIEAYLVRACLSMPYGVQVLNTCLGASVSSDCHWLTHAQGRLRMRGWRVGRRHGGACVHGAAARRLPARRSLRAAQLDGHRTRADRVGETRCRRH